MKFSTALVCFVPSLLHSIVYATVVSYDEVYDTRQTSLSNVACSDGSNGMLTRGYTTFGSLPKFPYIGGYSGIASWNSPNCGSCHQLTYTNGTGAKKSINVLAIDKTDEGYNIALAAMKELTGGQAEELGRVSVTDIVVDRSVCGLNCK